ncbi:hypothetical protein [Pedobacter chitinilyticus]|uniref:Uncharacterized protein n=1 Tax=Pedobacter chitinilyticus TaxID=2233776 RepID=A0A443YW98_9SPHI|nr:hypothetical protein [Pedobacter chitinilyticus]RWU08227.1 hypothetical protein DPV69_07565 [Pedobacter chitinilyticus]
MQNKFLKKLKATNDQINVVNETEHLNLEGLWDDDTFMCRFKNDEDFSSLEHIFLPPELAALYHTDSKTIEYIYTPLNEEDAIVGRKFNFYFRGDEFEAEFSEPSDALRVLSKGFREKKISSSTNYRNLSKFRDFYIKDDLPNHIQRYFEKKKPISFKVKGNFKGVEENFVEFSKNLNFYLEYYDRRSPFILIYEVDAETENFSVPCYNNSNDYPKTMNVRKLDPVLIDLFEVARVTSNTRMKFLFYFQVLEYCSYYHFSEEFKRKITNIIKRPDLIENSSFYGKLITEEFKDNFKQNDDSAKLEKLIIDFLSIEDIKLEIAENIEYFKKDITFDGGFVISALVGSVQELDNTSKTFLKTVKTNVEKIRNVLVHIRESRENKIILPTTRNTNLLSPYLHLIQRIAEKVALQYE